MKEGVEREFDNLIGAALRYATHHHYEDETHVHWDPHDEYLEDAVIDAARDLCTSLAVVKGRQ